MHDARWHLVGLEKGRLARLVATDAPLATESHRDLRPTRQRVAIGKLLFAGRDRHVTAEMLHEEVAAAGERISLATVYNTLHQFERAGLVRELAIDGAKTYFDTNTSNHNHFFIESEGRVIDIPGHSVEVLGVLLAG